MAGKRGPSPTVLAEYQEYLLQHPTHGRQDFSEASGIPMRELRSGQFRKVESKVAKLLRQQDEARCERLRALMEQEADKEAEQLYLAMVGMRSSLVEAYAGDSPVFCDKSRDVLNTVHAYKLLRDIAKGTDDATESAPVLWEIDRDDQG